MRAKLNNNIIVLIILSTQVGAGFAGTGSVEKIDIIIKVVEGDCSSCVGKIAREAQRFGYKDRLITRLSVYYATDDFCRRIAHILKRSRVRVVYYKITDDTRRKTRSGDLELVYEHRIIWRSNILLYRSDCMKRIHQALEKHTPGENK
jgi:hypothetical protein